MDKRKAAEIILHAIDDYAPVTVNRNMKKWWLDAIMIGLTEIEKKKKPQELQLPGNQGNS